MSAKLNLIPMQDWGVRKSYADDMNLIKDFEYAPKWSVKKGVKNFIQ